MQTRLLQQPDVIWSRQFELSNGSKESRVLSKKLDRRVEIEMPTYTKEFEPYEGREVRTDGFKGGETLDGERNGLYTTGVV
jgi:hypothetical protein